MDAAYLGFIEGFYGKSYSDSERSYLLDFMGKNGYRFYIYSPKADHQLRDKWQDSISEEYERKLASMKKECVKHGLDFGITLSPMNLTENFKEQKDLVIERIKTLCRASQCEIFCLLFDDMFKSSDDIGKQQNEVIKLVEQNLPEHVKHFIICPTYYSYDECLPRIFGAMPKTYFEDLMKGMPERVEIFWTGEKVLSKDYSAEHIEEVTKLLGRKPFIWDNYPVNDGKDICHYLFLNKFKGRTNLTGKVTGHAVNPMVQCYLSTLSAITLPLIYQGKSTEEINSAYLKYAKELFGAAAHELLKGDNLKLLTDVGLKKMSAMDKVRMRDICLLDRTPALEEIYDYLHGSMRFDQSIVNGTNPIVMADNATADQIKE